MEKSNEEAMELFKTLCEHSQQFSSRGRQGVKSKGMYEVNTNSKVKNQMDVLQKTLNMLVNTMTTQNISPVQQFAQL
jgi:hypothetical protein